MFVEAGMGFDHVGHVRDLLLCLITEYCPCLKPMEIEGQLLNILGIIYRARAWVLSVQEQFFFDNVEHSCRLEAINPSSKEICFGVLQMNVQPFSETS